MKSNLGKTALLAASLLSLSGCVSTSENVSAEQQTTPIIQSQQNSVDTIVSAETPEIQSSNQYLIEYLYPGLETDLTLDIPEQFQDENGLFLLRFPNSKYYNETWNRGYAGMFTEEDIAGRSIKGYDITLPLQIAGNWSANPEDYFDRVEHPRLGGLTTEATLYYGDIDSYMFYNKLPFLEKTPYFELDKAYADMIKADDTLTPEEQLELIIMNHKGYIDPLFDNISDILEEHYISDEFRDDIGFGSGVLFNDTMHDEFLIGIHEDHLGTELADKFLLSTLASLKVLEFRLPEFYDFISLDAYQDEIIFAKNLRNRDPDGTNTIYNGFNKLDLFSSLVDSSFGSYISTFIHESIHGIIKGSNLLSLGIGADSSFWLNNPDYNSEIMTYGNSIFAKELLNGNVLSLKGDNLNTWYSLYGSNYDSVPLEHFSAIITNQQ